MQKIVLIVLAATLPVFSWAGDLADSKNMVITSPACAKEQLVCVQEKKVEQQSSAEKSPKKPAEKDEIATELEPEPLNLELSKKALRELLGPPSQVGSQHRAFPNSSTESGNTLSFKADKLGQNIARAARVDCRTKYVSPTPNLLLLIPLLYETVTDTGCKW